MRQHTSLARVIASIFRSSSAMLTPARHAASRRVALGTGRCGGSLAARHDRKLCPERRACGVGRRDLGNVRSSAHTALSRSRHGAWYFHRRARASSTACAVGARSGSSRRIVVSDHADRASKAYGCVQGVCPAIQSGQLGRLIWKRSRFAGYTSPSHACAQSDASPAYRRKSPRHSR